MIQLMYITNNIYIAKMVQEFGVNRIFVDMEFMGKNQRQAALDSVKNHHTVQDIYNVREAINSSKGNQAELLVRVNPIHSNSKQEINAAIMAGADILTLPMWKSVDDVQRFINCVCGRAKVQLLLETKEAVESIDDVLKVDGIDEIHIGLNDLHLSYGMKFMFEPLVNGLLDTLACKMHDARIPFGFGGIARIGGGSIPAERILAEHYRLGSCMVILSRSFCNTSAISDSNLMRAIYKEEILKIREKETEIIEKNDLYLLENHLIVTEMVKKIIEEI